MKRQQFSKNKLTLLQNSVKPEQYGERLQQLLNKIQVQNRYSNRISITNLLNLSKFETVKKELDMLKEQRKVQQMNEVQMKNLNQDLHKQINQLKQQLEITSLNLITTKKQIKQLQQNNKQLQDKIIELKENILYRKRKQMNELTSFKLSIVTHLLQGQIKQFLAKTQWADHLLIKHCREAVINQNYNNFFQNLYSKMNQQNNQRNLKINSSKVTRIGQKRKTSVTTNSKIKNMHIRPDFKIEKSQTKIILIPPIKSHRRIKTLSSSQQNNL